MASASPLPVFNQPAELKFVASDSDTHKQVLTIYNPYEFRLQYVVLSNVPNKLRVVDARGFISAKCYVDVMVRHLSPASSLTGSNDCLRIEIYRDDNDTILGRKDVPIQVLASNAVRNMDNGEFQSFPTTSILRSGTAQKTSRNVYFNTTTPPANHGNSAMMTGFMIACLVVGLAILFLPAEPYGCEETTSQPSAFNLQNVFPPALRPTITVKLVSSFILGLVTYAIFQQNH